MALDEGKNEPPPSILVLLDPAKSEDPPQNSGKCFAIALMTCPDAARVATSLPGAKVGISESQPAGKALVRRRSKSFVCSGLLDCQVANFVFHSLRTFAARSFTKRACVNTSAGIANFSSGFKPKATLVAAISSSPSAEP